MTSEHDLVRDRFTAALGALVEQVKADRSILAVILGGQGGVSALVRYLVRVELKKMHTDLLERVDWACSSISTIARELGHPLKPPPKEVRTS